MSEQIEDLTNYKTEKENYIKQLEKSKVEQEILQEEELKKLERKVTKQVKIIDELVIRLKEKKNVHTL
jgi:TPP-dependent pyruvate/acetoin dehydrogenase alpha subunit